MSAEVSTAVKLREQSQTDSIVAKKILSQVMVYRRAIRGPRENCSVYCSKCHEPHLTKVISAVQRQEPVEFVLPAFPGKSPNRHKVLGHLPDLAEKQALMFLNELCTNIESVYAPGAKILICSDGRVFSDVIGIEEKHVTEYQIELENIIFNMQLEHLSTFHLDDLDNSASAEQLRGWLMQNFAMSLDSLRQQVKRGSQFSIDTNDREAHRMYCGITRFLFEDSLRPEDNRSKTTVQRESRKKAYEVIRRSQAWSELISSRFSSAVRLSIHPQPCGSKKLGIQLLGENSWMTPWHGVAVIQQGKTRLMKKWEAEKLNARLIYDGQGRPSHYELEDNCMGRACFSRQRDDFRNGVSI